MKLSSLLGLSVGFMTGFFLILSASTSREVTMWFDEMHTFWTWTGVSFGCALVGLFVMPRIIDAIFKE